MLLRVTKYCYHCAKPKYTALQRMYYTSTSISSRKIQNSSKIKSDWSEGSICTFFFKDIDGKTLSLSRPRLLRSFFDGLQRSSNLEVTNERARCRGKNPAIKISFS